MAKSKWYFVVLCLVLPVATYAGEVHVAVAANFLATMQTLAKRFESIHPDQVSISSGSTGKLYAQIMHGAPYDIFLAADIRRPELLERKGRTLPNSRFTYAIGRLALWSRQPSVVDNEGSVLRGSAIKRLAIANPKTAPYGAAAREVLMHMGLWKTYQDRIVRGENVGQTFQFVATDNVDAGFVALSQVNLFEGSKTGSLWIVPTSLYSPIEQQAVMLNHAQGNEAAQAFVTFLRSSAAREIIKQSGYRMP
jgi:molybdate transport system substrate-binding protein